MSIERVNPTIRLRFYRGCFRLNLATGMWDNPTMTLTADSKKLVDLTSAAPGDVFVCNETADGLVVRRVYRQTARTKKTKAEVLKAIKNWKAVPKIRWEELRKMTREP